MRLVIDARESGSSTGRYVDKLIEYLHQLKPAYEVVILAKSPRLEYLRSVAPGFKILESNHKEFSFNEQLGFAWRLYRLKPDLVHFTMTQQPLMYFGKSVTTIHDLTTVRFYNPAKNWLLFRVKQLVYKGVVRVVARKSQRLIAPSHFVKEDLAAYTKINPKKISVIYEAAEKSKAAPEPVKELEGQLYRMYVGRALPHKNLQRLVDAFQELSWTYPDLKLALVGKRDYGYHQLQKYAKDKKLSGLVFTDYVNDGQWRWLYEHAAVYAFPSLSEGFGLPGLEAMLYGLPVASSNASCLPEIYKDAAVYFDPTSVHDMADKIKQLLDDRKLADELAAKGRRLSSEYSWQKMARQTLDVYKEILNK